MGCCCSKPVDGPLAGTPSKGEAPQETQPKEIQGRTPVDEPPAAKRETQPKKETQEEAPSKHRARDTGILLSGFASIIFDGSELLKPMKVVSDGIKKALELAKVSFNLLDETSLFTKPQRTCRK